MVVVRSDGVDDKKKRVRMLKGVELWGLTANGKHWKFISETSREIIVEIKKPYVMIKGCLEERNGTIRVALIFNFRGVWDIIWLSYDIGRGNWTRVVLPNCQMKDSSLFGISFSSGLVIRSYVAQSNINFYAAMNPKGCLISLYQIADKTWVVGYNLQI
ncbi:hypothetical protein RJ640_029654 [Escallonia rubra]|uniref:Uncharacterized protein n=1 Tax=Escallonia rubra TaxID=112253 RepID=A0AA88QE04_9ASTE|nr:hypothetical protein RJ640_029654 [Escallonia rubra]